MYVALARGFVLEHLIKLTKDLFVLACVWRTARLVNTIHDESHLSRSAHACAHVCVYVLCINTPWKPRARTARVDCASALLPVAAVWFMACNDVFYLVYIICMGLYANAPVRVCADWNIKWIWIQYYLHIGYYGRNWACMFVFACERARAKRWWCCSDIRITMLHMMCNGFCARPDDGSHMDAESVRECVCVWIETEIHILRK